MQKYLNIDSDLDMVLSHSEIWREHGIGLDSVDTIAEGVKLLMSNEYLFVAINGDAIDFIPLLSVMWSVTNIPILIGISNFDSQAEIASFLNGVDSYAWFYNTKEDNINSILTYAVRKNEGNIRLRKLMVYKYR
jgi:hypothetical protein